MKKEKFKQINGELYIVKECKTCGNPFIFKRENKKRRIKGVCLNCESFFDFIV